MKQIIFALVLAVILISCNSQAEKGVKSTEEVLLIPIENVVSSAGELADNMIKTTGLVTHICRHGGQKLFLTDESNEIHLLVKVSSSIPEFDLALEGSMLEVTGKLIATVTTSADIEGHNHSEEEECAAETKMKERSDSVECTTNITYHLEAISYK